RRIASFPRPGAAGSFATIDDVDGDGRTEVVAEIGPDSLFYVYDAGAGTWRVSNTKWRTPRGNMGRTGAHDGPPLPSLDDVAPAAIDNLLADSVRTDRTHLMWTSPGDDVQQGQATRYDIQFTTVSSEA